MKGPLVSINIPVYKCEDYLLRCLESVKTQTYKNLEIILINDCTPDNSVEIIEEFFKENPELNYRLIHNERNRGLSVVRNRAIEHSTGKYIYMLDSDDYILPECIEKLVSLSEETDADITVGESISLYSDTGEKKVIFPIRAKEKVLEGNELIFERFIESSWPIVAWNKLYQRNWILDNKLEFIEGLYSQDELWSFHCAFKLNKIAFLKEVTHVYFLHSKSIIYNKTKVNFENHQTIVEWFTKSYHESPVKIKKLIKKKIINFKSLTLLMQWRFMRDDKVYWKQNYARLKKAPGLSFTDYFSSRYSTDLKKQDFFLSLPDELGYRLFKWRFER